MGCFFLDFFFFFATRRKILNAIQFISKEIQYIPLAIKSNKNIVLIVEILGYCSSAQGSLSGALDGQESANNALE